MLSEIIQDGVENMGKLRTNLLLIVLLILVPAAPLFSRALDNEDLEAFFDGVFSVQLPQYHVPGAEVVVVGSEGVLFSKGYGFSDLEKGIPMEPGVTLHRPGSNGKILVWLAVMQLAEQGKLNLYEDINTYLDFTIPSRVEGREAPPITLHHLLTHTAGFEDEVSMLFVSEAELMKPLGQYVQEHLPARVFTPGSVMAYSNYGTTLAAYIVELISGQPFAQYVQEKILEPLGMDSSTFEQPLPRSLADRMSQGYRWDAGQFVPGGFEYVQSYPAGGLTSSSLDMARLIQAQLNLGLAEVESEARILAEETARTMQAQQFSAHPELPGMAYGLIEAEFNGRRVLSHGGDTLLFSTGLYFLPEEKIGLYVVYNSTVSGAARDELFAGFMDRYFPAQGEAAVARPLAAETAHNYTGLYHNSRANFSGIESILRILSPLQVSVDEGGFLVVEAFGQVKRYGEVAPGLFQELYGEGKIAFSFEGGQAVRIHGPGPVAYLRTPWHQSLPVLTVVLGIVVLFMLITILGWIRGAFRQRQRPLILPKGLAILYILAFFTSGVLLVDLFTTTHPTLGVPLMILEPSSTLKVLLILTKILMGLGGLLVLTTIYLLAAGKGSVWQRIHYTLLTLSALCVNLILWQVNLW